MTSNDIAGLFMTSSFGLMVVVIAVCLLFGKGSSLIAGYNTLPEAEKRKYDARSLCRFVGKILLPIGILAPLVAIGGIYHIGWMVWAYLAMVVALVAFALIYCNTQNRFKK